MMVWRDYVEEAIAGGSCQARWNRENREEDEKAFREWCELSGVDLAPVDEGSIASGCESENEKLGDGNNYDLEILRKRDKPVLV